MIDSWFDLMICAGTLLVMALAFYVLGFALGMVVVLILAPGMCYFLLDALYRAGRIDD